MITLRWLVLIHNLFSRYESIYIDKFASYTPKAKLAKSATRKHSKTEDYKQAELCHVTALNNKYNTINYTTGFALSREAVIKLEVVED